MNKRAAWDWIVWIAALALATLVLLAFRDRLDKAHVVLVYILIVLGGSASGGRLIGVALSISAFVLFDVLFLPPYGTLVVRNPLDWLALVAFLATSLVAAQLLYTARARRAAAERAEALREAGRMKDSLLAALSHDLRTPLTSIKGLAHELSESGDERAVMIEHEADTLNRLVSDLLDVARLNAGPHIPLDLQVNALDDLIGAAVQRFESRADRNRIAASLVGSELIVGRFDFAQTLRIVTNLIENALKYSPIDTTVELTGSLERESVCVRVSDRGPGIARSDAERVFEPFVRVAGTNGASTSTGLGLSIARGLAEVQGGTVSYSQRSDGGSVFTLRLPAARME